MAKAHLEITGGILRVGPDGFRWGDQFDLVIPLIGDEQTAILKGLQCPGFGFEEKEAISEALREHGFTHYARWRHRDGEAPRFVRIRL